MERASLENRWGLSEDAVAGLERALGGDVEGFGIVCLELETALWRQAMMLCGDEEIAEDLAQEALITAWRRLDRFDGSCRFQTWVMGILLNLYRNAARKKQAVSESQLNEEEASGHNREASDSGSFISRVIDPSAGPAEQVVLLERASLVRKCLERLPEEQRSVVQLRFFAGAGIGEIAAALGCPEGTIKSRLFHAIMKLSGMKDLREALFGTDLEESI